MPSLRFIIHHEVSICLFGFPTKKNDRIRMPRVGRVNKKAVINAARTAVLVKTILLVLLIKQLGRFFFCPSE